jgi:hypothetical protein
MRGWHVGVLVVVRGGGCWQGVVIGVGAPVRLVAIVLVHVFELAYLIVPIFVPLLLSCLVSLVSELLQPVSLIF